MFSVISKLCAFAGEISYDVYLFHVPLILLIGDAPRNVFVFTGYIVVLVVFSWLVRVGLEQPILGCRPSYSDPKAGELATVAG